MHVVANVPFIPKEVVVLLSSRLRSSIPTRLSELGDVIRFIGLHDRTQLQHLNMLNYRSCGACMDRIVHVHVSPEHGTSVGAYGLTMRSNPV